MTRKIDCPQCGKPSEYSSDNPWRPFCSKRCRLIDLGEWASEGYQIPAAPELDDYSTGLTPDEQPFTPTRH